MYGCHYVACAGVLLWNEDLRVAAKPERKRRWKGRSSLQPAVQRSGSADHGSERPGVGGWGGARAAWGVGWCGGAVVVCGAGGLRPPLVGGWCLAVVFAPRGAAHAQVVTNI